MCAYVYDERPSLTDFTRKRLTSQHYLFASTTIPPYSNDLPEILDVAYTPANCNNYPLDCL